MNFHTRIAFLKTTASLLALCMLGLPSGAFAQLPPREKVTIRYGYLPIPVMPLFSAKVYKLLVQCSTEPASAFRDRY